ncbi:MAG: hypothetical protein U0R24_00500 [Solirubrobacterales bacterium]
MSLGRCRGIAATLAGVALAVAAFASPAQAEPTREDALRTLAAIARSPVGLSYDREVIAGDFASAREQAGLPADADVLSYAEASPFGPDGPFGQFVRETIPFADTPFGRTAELRAFEGTAITASAHTAPIFGEPGTAVVATMQPAREVRRRLVAAGMKRRHGVLTGTEVRGKPSDFPYIADAGEGLFVLTDSLEAARLVTSATLPVSRKSTDNGAAVAAGLGDASPFLGVIARRSGCVRRTIVTQDVEPMTGTITLAGPLRRHDVEVERELKRDYEVGPLRRQGSELSVAISPSGDYDPSTLAYSGLLDKRFALRPLCTRR